MNCHSKIEIRKKTLIENTCLFGMMVYDSEKKEIELFVFSMN